MLIQSQSGKPLFYFNSNADLKFKASPFGFYHALHLLKPKTERWCLCGLYRTPQAAMDAIGNCHSALSTKHKKFRFSSDKETVSAVEFLESLAD